MAGEGTLPTMRAVPVTMAIAAVTTLASLLIIFGGLIEPASVALGFLPARLFGRLAAQDLSVVPAILTPLTSTLVHGGFLHLGFNLLMLLWCGKEIERVLGQGATLALYLIAAYAAAAAQWIVAPMGLNPVVGASGAISGLVGAYALSFGRPKRLVNSPRINRWLNIAWLAAAWAALQWAVGFTSQTPIAIPAHIGGFLAGLLLQRPLLLWRYRRA